MTYQTIVSTSRLAEHLRDPDWVVFDCRFVLSKPEQGREQYLQSHVAGAYYMDLDRDLASPRTATSGRHPLPVVKDLEDKLRRWGVNNTTQVVVYDDASSALAARAWWVLRWLGHRSVAVLDGGLRKWCDERRELGEGNELSETSGDFTAVADDNAWIDVDALSAGLGNDNQVIIDARAAERYSGEKETVDPEGGHIPTAINRPLNQNLDDKHCFLSAEQLRKAFEPLQKPLTIHSCGSGVTACHNCLAMEIAGLTGSRVYIGSWSEWIQSPQRPRVQGSSPV